MNEDAKTVWCGNLSENVSEEILYELFLQAGPLQRVHIPKTREGKQRAFGFVTFKHECSVPYALSLFDGTELFNRQLKLQSRNTERTKLFNLPTINRPSLHNRTQSLPVQLPVGLNNFNSLLLLGQHLQNSVSPYIGNSSKLYASQIGSAAYLGGTNRFNDNLSAKSLQGNWSNRNHPYARDGGGSSGNQKRHNDNRNNHRKR